MKKYRHMSEKTRNRREASSSRRWIKRWIKRQPYYDRAREEQCKALGVATAKLESLLATQSIKLAFCERDHMSEGARYDFADNSILTATRGDVQLELHHCSEDYTCWFELHLIHHRGNDQRAEVQLCYTVYGVWDIPQADERQPVWRPDVGGFWSLQADASAMVQELAPDAMPFLPLRGYDDDAFVASLPTVNDAHLPDCPYFVGLMERIVTRFASAS